MFDGKFLTTFFLTNITLKQYFIIHKTHDSIASNISINLKNFDSFVIQFIICRL